MKLFLVLAVAAWCNAAKLDNTYLPPSHSQSSGGSGSFLQTPLGSSLGLNGQANGFERNSDNFGQNDNGFAQNGNGFGQNGNGFAQNDNGFGQNGNDFAQNGDFSQNGNDFGSFENQPERPQAAFERNAAIIRQDNQNDGETYSYAYETENGIYAEENGVATNGVEAQGGYSYTGDDGQVYSVRYTADQNGFVPQGDHLPTPPPVPEEILKALEQNTRDEAAGIYDDGSYNEGKYSDEEQQYNNGNNFNSGNGFNNGNEFNNGNDFNNQNEYEGDDDSVVTTNALFRQSGNFNNGVSSQGATSQAYLPPVAAQRDSTNQGGFNNGNSRFESGSSNQGATQAYLPPHASQRGSSQGSFNNGNANQRFDSGAASQTYLPPSAGQRGLVNGGFNNGNANQGRFNDGNSNQGGFNNGNGSQGSFEQANKAYLPPNAQRSSNGGFGSRTRQPSFSARNGYRY